MNGLIWFFITLAAAACGGIVFQKLKIPAGPLVGALTVVGLLNIFTGRMFMPSKAKIFAQAVSGLFIGMSVNMNTVRNLKKLIKPAILLVVIIETVCLFIGILLSKVSGLDEVTSLFCVAPGGMMDMTLFCMDLGGDSSVVAVLQVIRLLSVYFISMPIAKYISQKGIGATRPDADIPEDKVEETTEKTAEIDAAEKRKRIAFSACVAACGGALGYVLAQLADFSSLVLITSMVVSATVNIKTGRLMMPRKVRYFAQILSGSLIGLNMTYESLMRIKAALIPAIFVCISFVLLNILLAFVIHRSSGLDMPTAMLSSSAGGATESALVAMDFGARPAIVSVLQVTRLACTTAIYPMLAKFVLPLLMK